MTVLEINSSTIMTKPLILERTTFGWRVKAPQVTTPLIWRVIPTPFTLCPLTLHPVPNTPETHHNLPVSPHHPIDPASGPTSALPPEKDKESSKEDEEGDHRGDDPGGVRCCLKDSHLVDPVHSGTEE
jgi:hypothetical protein